MIKQGIFYYINVIYTLKIKNILITQVALSKTGNVKVGFALTILLNYTGGIFLSIVKTVIPEGPYKLVVKNTQNVINFPIALLDLLEYVSNNGIGVLEQLFMIDTLSTNRNRLMGIIDSMGLSKWLKFKQDVTGCLKQLAEHWLNEK